MQISRIKLRYQSKLELIKSLHEFANTRFQVLTKETLRTPVDLWERQTGGPTWIWVGPPQLAMYKPWSKTSVDKS
jgi:hypothetical protein